jgi:EAL and modified HD-GYP domain-containing signal transduction protein
MHEVNFIVREPLLDPKQRVLGYALDWQQIEAGATGPDALVDFAAGQLNDAESGWLLGDCVLFLDASPALLSNVALQAMPPKNTVLSLSAADLADADTRAAANALRDQGYGIALRNADAVASDQALLSQISHIEVERGATDFAAQAKLHGAFKPSSVRMVARRVDSWQEYNACVALGLDAYVGQVYLTPRPGNQAKGMNASQAIIVQLMDLVRKNADVRELEAVLKRDAALSYKLFRYINSVGFGLGAEVQSLRHAVTMLGYSTLYRWLSLLLATASTGGYAAVLMQTAIIRGRFAELLGHGLLTKSEAEDLFVTGMFSLLDRLLGIPMEQVLEHIQLPEAVSQALLSREGMYGPFLALTEACEIGNGQAGELADSLFISPRQVNEAHLAALAWAQNLKI